LQEIIDLQEKQCGIRIVEMEITLRKAYYRIQQYSEQRGKVQALFQLAEISAAVNYRTLISTKSYKLLNSLV
jgi:hypothetical protein